MRFYTVPLRALEERGGAVRHRRGCRVILHGYGRLTGDVDVFVAIDRENTTEAMKALTALGLRPIAPMKFKIIHEARSAEE